MCEYQDTDIDSLRYWIIEVRIGSGNGSIPFAAKPPLEPMLVCYQSALKNVFQSMKYK